MAFLVATASAAGPGDDSIAVVVRSEVTIDQPASVVWPWLFDLKSWKPAIGALERVAGRPDADGELRLVVPADGNAAGSYYVQTVKLVHGRQLVYNLFPRNGGLFSGFADFSLHEADDRTTVIYDVYVDYRVPGLSEEQRRSFIKKSHDEMKVKLDAEHLRLKTLVEDHTP